MELRRGRAAPFSLLSIDQYGLIKINRAKYKKGLDKRFLIVVFCTRSKGKRFKNLEGGRK